MKANDMPHAGLAPAWRPSDRASVSRSLRITAPVVGIDDILCGRTISRRFSHDTIPQLAAMVLGELKTVRPPMPSIPPRGSSTAAWLSVVPWLIPATSASPRIARRRCCVLPRFFPRLGPSVRLWQRLTGTTGSHTALAWPGAEGDTLRRRLCNSPCLGIEDRSAHRSAGCDHRAGTGSIAPAP